MLRDKKYPLIVLNLLVFLLPFELIFSTIATIILIVAVVFMVKPKEITFPNFHNSYLFIFYFLLALVGVFYSENPTEAVDRVIRQLPMLLFPLALILIGLNVGEKEKLKKTFVWACALFCLISLGALLYGVLTKYEQIHHYNFVQRSMYKFHFPYDTLYLNVAYVFLLFGDFNSWTKKILSFIFFIVIFLFGVRTGIATFFIITAFYIILNIKVLATVKNGVFLIVTIAASIVLVKQSRYLEDKYYGVLETVGLISSKEISDVGAEYHNISLRSELWLGSWETIKKRPVFGYGTYGETKYLEHEFSINGLEEKNQKLNSHNQYLSTVLQHGLFGGALLLLILLRSLFLAIKARNIEGALFVFVCMAAFVTESFLIRQKGIMLFVLFICLLIEENVFLQETGPQRRDKAQI